MAARSQAIEKQNSMTSTIKLDSSEEDFLHSLLHRGRYTVNSSGVISKIEVDISSEVWTMDDIRSLSQKIEEVRYNLKKKK